MPSELPPATSVVTYIEDGLRIAAILLVWGILATLLTTSFNRFGLRGERLAVQLGNLLLITGTLNAVLYVGYRLIDYHNAD